MPSPEGVRGGMKKISMELSYTYLEKGIILCFFKDATLGNVREARNFIVITRKPEPRRHDISILVLDTVDDKVDLWDNIISQVKMQYGDNLVALLDAKGTKI